MARTIILTGPVRSGKTTLCLKTFAQRPDVGGVACPDGEHGRKFVDLMTGANEPLEGPEAREPFVMVGRYRFRSAGFAWANARIVAAIESRSIVSIDEAGPLELRGEGLAPALAAAVIAARTLVLVVRAGLVDAVVERFALQAPVVVTADAWPQLWQAEKAVP